MTGNVEPRERPTPALPSEPWVLRHSLWVLLGGGLLAVLAFGLAYRLEGGDQFGPRFDVGLRAATGVAAVTAGLLTWSRLELSRREHYLAADAELTDRFGRAVAQLGSTESVIRVGGVFALERFALDAAARAGDRRDVDWRMALNLLAAFAKERSRVTWIDSDFEEVPDPNTDPTRQTPPAPPIETVEAVKVLGRFPHRCEVRADLPHDLSHINLAHVDLTDVDLAGTDLSYATLSYVDFAGANLEGANLLRADLTHADLTNASLRNAVLGTAVIRWTRLLGADLRGADLEGVDLSSVRHDDRTTWPDGVAPPPNPEERGENATQQQR